MSQNRGILPTETLNALDALVDRLNASSGFDPHGHGAQQHPPVRALLVGTNEGVGLSRSLGSGAVGEDDHDSSSTSSSPYMSEEVLSAVETVWATLPSAAPPHVMAAAAAAAAAASAGGGDGAEHHHQPPHPLLSPLGLGDEVRTVEAFYENCTLVHVHMSPLVVTLLTTPTANIGAIRSTALPMLRALLEPVRKALLRSRGQALVAAAAGAQNQQQQQQQQMMQQQGFGMGYGQSGQMVNAYYESR